MARIASSNRTRFRPQAEPSETDLAAVRQNILTQATVAAFGAGTLEEAQAILGGANPSLATSISFDVDFASVTSAAPALSATRTAVVPVGNPGQLLFSSDFSVSYSMNGAGFTTAATGGVLTLADGDTLQWRRSFAGTSAVVSLNDSTTGATVNPDFTLHAT